MEKLKELFGDKALTYTELEEALKGRKDIKLANLADGGFVDKGKFSAMETQVSELKAQLTQRDTDLAELKKLDAAGLQQKVTDLQAKYDADTRALGEKLTAQATSHQIDLALTAAKAKNITAARALIKMENVKLDGEKLIGLDEQLKSIAKENPWLFGEPEKNPTPPGAAGKPVQVDEITQWRAEAGLPPLKQ